MFKKDLLSKDSVGCGQRLEGVSRALAQLQGLLLVAQGSWDSLGRAASKHVLGLQGYRRPRFRV